MVALKKCAELPIPSHLKEFVEVDGKKSSENDLRATLCCCENKEFGVQMSRNDYVCVVKAICTKCNADILIFDSRFHGWDGYVCHQFREEEPGPFKPVVHKGENTFIINLRIQSEGKQDFIDEACQGPLEPSEQKFEEEEWVNAFGEIIINLSSFKRGKKLCLIADETM